jgi:hypothetical protein
MRARQKVFECSQHRGWSKYAAARKSPIRAKLNSTTRRTTAHRRRPFGRPPPSTDDEQGGRRFSFDTLPLHIVKQSKLNILNTFHRKLEKLLQLRTILECMSVVWDR